MTAADMSARAVPTDIEILGKKNAQIKRLRLQSAGQWIVIVLLAFTIAAIALVSRFGNPSPQPNINVINRVAFDKDGSNIRVPATYNPGDERPTITAGIPFTYNTKGEKLEAIGGNIDYQLTCLINGSEALTNIGSAYSNAPKGKFNTTRSYTILVSTRLQDSDKCRLQTIVSYTFYQADAGGGTRPIEVKEIGLSNYFKLRVPKDKDGNIILNPTQPATTTNSTATGTSGALPSSSRPAEQVAEAPEQTNIPEQSGGNNPLVNPEQTGDPFLRLTVPNLLDTQVNLPRF